MRCPDCVLPFVYHLIGSQLRCHHCGRTARPPEKCPHCGSRLIRYFGAGTQRVEAELRARFPSLRVSRLDSDALAVRRGFESIYDDFRDGRVDVLVGTQPAAKGLDLPSVTLAAVIAADVTLNLPDYLAPERTLQPLAQGAGRSGRRPPVLWASRAAFRGPGRGSGATTLRRFYAIHMLLIPGLLAAMIGAHLYLVAKLGITAPPWSKPHPNPELSKSEA